MKLSIIIPACNEEKIIETTLKEYYSFFKNKFKNDFEILVILNGCKDNTLSVVEKFARGKKQIRYEDYKEKIGKGGAVINGIKIAQSELIGFVDADLSTKPNAFYDLIKNIGSYDCIIASRWIKGAKVLVRQAFLRRFASRGFNYMVRFFFNLQLYDTQCGAKLFKKEAIKKIQNDLGVTNWAWDIDLLYKLKLKKFIIKELPTEWNERFGKSSLKLQKTIPEMFLSIIRLRLVHSRFKFIVVIYNTIYKLIFGEWRL